MHFNCAAAKDLTLQFFARVVPLLVWRHTECREVEHCTLVSERLEEVFQYF